MDEGYHKDESQLCVKDVLYDDLESMEKYQRRQKVYNEGLKVLEEVGLAYLIVLDDDYLGYPMMIIHD